MECWLHCPQSTKSTKCEKCVNIIGGDEETGLDIDGLDEETASFVNSINRGGLIKPSDILYISCIISWTMYKKMLDNEEAKSYFLSCKAST